jgi:hypothetical protein
MEARKPGDLRIAIYSYDLPNLHGVAVTASLMLAVLASEKSRYWLHSFNFTSRGILKWRVYSRAGQYERNG